MRSFTIVLLVLVGTPACRRSEEVRQERDADSPATNGIDSDGRYGEDAAARPIATADPAVRSDREIDVPKDVELDPLADVGFSLRFPPACRESLKVSVGKDMVVAWAFAKFVIPRGDEMPYVGRMDRGTCLLFRRRWAPMSVRSIQASIGLPSLVRGTPSSSGCGFSKPTFRRTTCGIRRETSFA